MKSFMSKIRAGAFPHALVAVVGLAAFTAPQAMAQELRGPIRLLVGYPPGGPADVTARIVADRLGAALDQSVIVENRPGACGQIAAQALKAAPGDGSLLFVSNTHTVVMIPQIMKNPGFAPASDFRMLGTIATFELALAAHPKTGATDVQTLGQWFSLHRAEASIGVPAPASAPEFIALKISKVLKADTVPVAYKGATPLVQDLLGGQIASGVSGISDFLQHHQAGKLRIVAVSGITPLLPGVPSFSQAGIAGLDLSDFQGLYAPVSMPPALAARINAALNQVLAQPDVKEKFRAQAMVPSPSTQDEHVQRLARASTGLAAIVKESGFKQQ